MSPPSLDGRRYGRFSHFISRRAILRLFIIGFLLYLIAAGFSGLRLSARAVGSADPYILSVALLAVALTYVAAATTYKLLAMRPIRFGPTLLVAISGGLVNRLLPGGLGGLGINAFYLKRNGHTMPAATAVVATNNLLGFMGNVLLIVATLAISPFSLPVIRMPQHTPFTLLALALVGLVVVVFVRANHRLALRSQRVLRDMATYVVQAWRRPLRLAGAVLSSCALTSLHATAFYLVLLALGSHQSPTVALLAVSGGVVAGAAIPTPGGIGGTEAGLAGSLVAFDVPASTAIAAALTYRAMTYWLPLIPGYIALRIVEKRYLY